jgi:hypothetical protein
VVKMPWTERTYQRMNLVYKDFLKDFIIKNDTNYEIKIKELLIKAEIQKRDFTKRQLNILFLILTFSFNYGKEKALLKLNDFSLSGVPDKKIRHEVTKLIEMNVIEWDQDFNEFNIVEPRLWKAPKYHAYYDDKRSNELFLINLKHAGVDVKPILEKLNEMEL